MNERVQQVYRQERVDNMAASILHMHSNKTHNDLYLQIPMWKERASTTSSANTKLNTGCSSKLETRPTNNKRPCDTDVERKMKRRRPSMSLSTGPCDQLSPSSRTCSTLSSRSTVGTCGGTSPRLTERQQLALIIQMTAEQDCHSNHQLHGGSGSRHVTGGSPSYSSGYSNNKSSSPRRPSAAVSRRNDRGETPLHRAARRGDVKQTKKLINEGADVNCRDNAGWTALHESCNHGRVSVARQLLKAGANSNALGYDDSTPLHDAASNGNILLVELLLRHGANPLLKNTDGQSPIDVASTPEVVRLLRSEVIASSSSDEDSSSYDVRSPISPESFCDDTDMTLSLTSPPPAAGVSHARSRDEKPQQQQQQHRHHPGFSDDDPAGLFSLTPPPEVNHVTVNSRQASPALPLFRMESDTHVDDDSPLPPLQIEYESAPPPAAAVTSQPVAVTSSQQQSGIYKKVTVTHHMDKSSASCGPRLTFRFQHIKKRDNSSSNNNNNNNNALIKRNPHPSVADQSSRTSCKPGSDIGSHVTSNPEVQNDVTMAAISSSVAASPVSDADVASPSTTQTVAAGQQSTGVQQSTGRQFEDISDAEDEETLPLLSGTVLDATKSTDTAIYGYNASVTAAGVHVGPATHAPSTGSVHWTDPLYPTYTDPMTYSPYSAPLAPLGGVVIDPISSAWQHDQMSSTGVTSLPLGVAGNATLRGTEVTSAAVGNDITSQVDDVTQRATMSHKVSTQIGNSSPIADATAQDARIDDVSALMPPLADAASSDAQTGNDVTPTTPKIPRLKIVMSSASDSQHSTTSPAGSCSLPYVVTVDSDSATRVVSALSPEGAAAVVVTSHSSGNSSNGVCEEAETLNVGTKHRRKIKHTSPVKVERDADSGSSSKEPLETESRGVDDVIADVTDQQPSERRMTRSAMRQHNKQQQQQHGGSTDNAQSETSGDQNNESGAAQRTTATSDTTDDEPVVTSHVSRRHHKHSKISAAHRAVANSNNNISASVASGDFVEMLATPVLSSQCKLTNPYAFYSALKKKLIEQQGELLSRPITSKLPHRVNDYLLVTRDYQLHSTRRNSNSSSSSNTKQVENLSANQRELLTEQGQQRDELRLQHQQERVRLHLLAEQEMLRVHDRLLRVTSGVGTSLSLSACAMLRMSCATCPEDLNIDKLTRQTGKDLIGLMEQVEKKFDKLKDDMLLRQQHEADVLYSTHRLQWNWQSHSIDSDSSTASAADNYIQLVAVDDHFNLFPA